MSSPEPIISVEPPDDYSFSCLCCKDAAEFSLSVGRLTSSGDSNVTVLHFCKICLLSVRDEIEWYVE